MVPPCPTRTDRLTPRDGAVAATRPDPHVAVRLRFFRRAAAADLWLQPFAFAGGLQMPL